MHIASVTKKQNKKMRKFNYKNKKKNYIDSAKWTSTTTTKSGTISQTDVHCDDNGTHNTDSCVYVAHTDRCLKSCQNGRALD